MLLTLDGKQTHIPIKHESEPGHIVPDLTLEANEHLVLQLPGGELLFVHHFVSVGYGIHFYEDPDGNPKVTIMGGGEKDEDHSP